ncbi:hypothetical protein M5689_010568 [Euphorbia peplus]|nr:hypothetical protein M5689_010568 [Euphorbia peplus]
MKLGERFSLWLQLKSLARVSSDHNPIILDTLGKQVASAKNKRVFQFERMWTPDPSCKDVIEQCWADGGARDDVHEKIKAAATRLTH